MYDPCGISVHKEVLNQSSDRNHFKTSVNTIVGSRQSKVFFFLKAPTDIQALFLIKNKHFHYILI